MARIPLDEPISLRVHEHSPEEAAEWKARGWDDRVDCRECVHRVGVNCEVFPRSMLVLHMVRHCSAFDARARPMQRAGR